VIFNLYSGKSMFTYLSGDGPQRLIFLAQLVSQRCDPLLHLVFRSPQITATQRSLYVPRGKKSRCMLNEKS